VSISILDNHLYIIWEEWVYTEMIPVSYLIPDWWN